MMLAILMTGLVLSSAPAAPLGEGDLGKLFGTLEAALRGSDAAAFQAGWDPAGYAANLVGGSGLPGERVYAQGSRKGWYLKADLATLAKAGRDDVVIVRCSIWSWKDDRAVDAVHALVIRDAKGRPVILGAGEEPAEVHALAARFIAGQPLAPPERE